VLRGSGITRLDTHVLDTATTAPVLLAPLGLASLAGDRAELVLAETAGHFGLPMVVSPAADAPLERIEQTRRAAADIAGHTSAGGWIELIPTTSEAVNRSLLARARNAGYSTLVISVDLPVMGWRPRALDQTALPFLQGMGLANYLGDPEFTALLAGGGRPAGRQEAVELWAAIATDPYLAWGSIQRLREFWDQPILLKGVQHPDDARRAVAAGVDGVIVSNHGGRQIDRAIGSLDALPAVVDAVDGDAPVLFDSGIRSGADIAVALALGADAVLVGRPLLWGLALAGAQGVQHVLRCLLAELQITCGLLGCASIADLGPDALVAASVPPLSTVDAARGADFLRGTTT
jgi:lactate 2-monooxygenase